MKIAMYPGSFYKFHDGHLKILEKSIKLFDKVFVVVSKNINKEEDKSLEERYQEISNKLKSFSNVEVLKNENMLTVDFAKQNNINYIIRGIRNLEDFDFEYDLYIANRNLSKEIETIYFFADEDNKNISSSRLKEIEFYKSIK